MGRIGAWLSLIGGGVAVASVVSGFLTIGGDPQYQGRLAFGVAALLLGAVAGIAGFLPGLRPAMAGALIVVAGVLGFAATLPWYINTYYFVALPLWIIGAELLLVGGFSARRA
ncbi:MAG: hypothetical protein ACRDID_17030 [Ktedonobacterales bacterium]